MTTQIKICGLSTEETIDAAVKAGATHIGLNHYEKSPRYVAPDRAAALRRHAGNRVKVVSLLVNAPAEQTAKILETIKPDIVQFHGTETVEWLKLVKQHTDLETWKALGVKDAPTLAKSDRFVGVVDKLLFDAPAQKLPGGTGTSFDWSLLANHQHKIPWGLAGGLTPANVADAIKQTAAALVDTSSGVESAPGVKDVDKIAAFCQAVRDYDKNR